MLPCFRFKTVNSFAENYGYSVNLEELIREQTSAKYGPTKYRYFFYFEKKKYVHEINVHLNMIF